MTLSVVRELDQTLQVSKTKPQQHKKQTNKKTGKRKADIAD